MGLQLGVTLGGEAWWAEMGGVAWPGTVYIPPPHLSATASPCHTVFLPCCDPWRQPILEWNFCNCELKQTFLTFTCGCWIFWSRNEKVTKTLLFMDTNENEFSCLWSSNDDNNTNINDSCLISKAGNSTQQINVSIGGDSHIHLLRTVTSLVFQMRKFSAEKLFS